MVFYNHYPISGSEHIFMVKDTNPYTIIIYGSTLIAAGYDNSIVDAHPIVTILKALYQFAAIDDLYVGKP